MTLLLLVGAGTSLAGNLLLRPLKFRREPAKFTLLALLAVVLFFAPAFALGATPFHDGKELETWLYWTGGMIGAFVVPPLVTRQGRASR